jgi:hypothetical protein
MRRHERKQLVQEQSGGWGYQELPRSNFVKEPKKEGASQLTFFYLLDQAVMETFQYKAPKDEVEYEGEYNRYVSRNEREVAKQYNPDLL